MAKKKKKKAKAKKVVIQKPDQKITSLACPSRDGNKMSTTWKNPGQANDSKSNRRWTTIDGYWFITANKGKSQNVDHQNGKAQVQIVRGRIWERGYPNTRTDASMTYNRANYHPRTAGVYLQSIRFEGWGWNSAGNGPHQASATFAFEPPAVPSVSCSYNKDNQTLSSTVKTDAGTAKKERYDTEVIIQRIDNYNSNYKNLTTVRGPYTPTATEYSGATYDLAEGQRLGINQYCLLRVRARNRGICGNSNWATASHMIAHPAQGTIASGNGKNITVNAKNATGVVTIPCNTNASAAQKTIDGTKYNLRPVDTVDLWRLETTEDISAIVAGNMDGWTKVDGSDDNSNCSGFTDMYGDLDIYDDTGRPKGTHIWYQMRSYHDDYVTRSVPVEAVNLYIAAPTAKDDVPYIFSATPLADGTSAELTIYLLATDDSTATEITWSDYERAWDSTKQPSPFTFTDEDRPPESMAVTTIDGKRYNRQTKIIVCDLTIGTNYFFRARRSMELSGGTQYSPYSDTASAQPVTTPSNVQLVAPAYVARGKDISVYWTFDGESEQKSWALYKLVDQTLLAIATGTDAFGSITIPYLSPGATEPLVADDEDQIELVVAVNTGGDDALSWSVTTNIDEEIEEETTVVSGVIVKMADPPTCSVVVDPVLTVQPLTFQVKSSSQQSQIVAKLYSLGYTFEKPDKTEYYVDGDIVWTDSVVPTWVAEEVTVDEETVTQYTATITATVSRSIGDGGDYILEAHAIDTVTGLVSETVSAPVHVSWAHQAEVPSDRSRAVGLPESKYAQITPVAPDSAISTDVCDIYRVTKDGVYLLVEGIPFGSVVIDRYAPYSKLIELFYRIVLRTADGDIAFRDIQYNVKGYHMRFDWSDKYVELPYNLKYNDSYAKDWQKRDHLDGGKPGYWNPAVTRKTSMSTDIIRLENPEEKRLIAELGSYPGAVFVRTPDGSAYQANVDVSGIPNDYDTLVMNVSFEATEVDLTDEFRVSASDITLPATEEEIVEPVEEP